ncbi:hypothetical protein [Sphingomonas sp. LT1P40]|uniref:hypothetical protein n=1 Tax=Alteristakelama amylovorans TaxID=3096166 RepID=UPI002FCAEE8C
MSDEPDSAVPGTSEPIGAEVSETEKPRTRQFRRKFDTPRLSPDAVARQGRIATIAWERLRDSAAVAAFLNTHDDTLDARPIDAAIRDDAGLAQVIARLDVQHPIG